jgi:prepilin peptidase CpaA
MKLLEVNHWPLWLAALVMLVAAIVNCGPKRRFPNWLTLPFIGGGWVLGLLHTMGKQYDAGIGTLVHALLTTAATVLLLLPVYSSGAVGAGTVKLQLGAGAWIGAFYGPVPGLSLVLWAFVGAGLLAALTFLVLQWKLRREVEEMIVQDPDMALRLITIGMLRRARLQRLPTGIPQFLAFVGCIGLYHLGGVLPIIGAE